MQEIKNIILSYKDISSTVFTNYTELLTKQENMLNEIENAKKNLISLGVDPDDETLPCEKHAFWPYIDSELEKQQQKIKIAQLKLSKCEFEYELLKNESSNKFYEFQKVNSQIMEMIVCIIQEVAYKEEQKKLTCKKKNAECDDECDDECEDECDDECDDDSDDYSNCINPDFPKEKKDKSVLLMITSFEPFFIAALSVLLCIHYFSGLSTR